MSNSVFIEGKANFVETTTTKSGKTVTKFSLGNVDRRGAYTYLKVEMWNAADEVLELLSGDQVLLVRGSIRVNEWENKDGDKRKSVFVNAFKIEDANTAQRSRPQASAASSDTTARNDKPVEVSDFGGDNPFSSDDPFAS